MLKLENSCNFLDVHSVSLSSGDRGKDTRVSKTAVRRASQGPITTCVAGSSIYEKCDDSCIELIIMAIKDRVN